MTLKSEDFNLDVDHLLEINRYFKTCAEKIRESGEELFCPALSVRFEFTPVFGRTILIRYDSEINEVEVGLADKTNEIKGNVTTKTRVV